MINAGAMMVRRHTRTCVRCVYDKCKQFPKRYAGGGGVKTGVLICTCVHVRAPG